MEKCIQLYPTCTGLGCGLDWFGRDSHNQVLRQEWRHFNDEAPTWSRSVGVWTVWILIHLRPHSAPCSALRIRRWEFGMKSVPCQGMCFFWHVCEWVHVSAGGSKAVIHSALHFVCEQNWFWCPEGIQFAWCCVCCNLGSCIPPYRIFSRDSSQLEPRHSVMSGAVTLKDSLRESKSSANTKIQSARSRDAL